jgi:hypothetical protein
LAPIDASVGRTSIIRAGPADAVFPLAAAALSSFAARTATTPRHNANSSTDLILIIPMPSRDKKPPLSRH